MPINVWDFSKNKIVRIEDDREAEKGVAEGRYALRKYAEDTSEEIRIPVVSPDGREGTIPSSKSQKAFQKGYRLRGRDDLKSSEEIREEAVKEVAADMPGTAFLKSAIGTATFGGSDVALRAAGVTDRQFSQALEEENPIASTAGAVTGGLAAPMFGPGAAVAKGAQLAGKAAQRAAAGSKLAGKVTEYGAEGLAYGLGESISDAALGDPNEIAMNLVLGGGLGASIGGISATAAPVVKNVFSKALQLGERAATGVYSGTTEALVKAATRATRGAEVAEELSEQLARRGEDGEKLYKQALSPTTTADTKQARGVGRDFIAQTRAENTALRNELKSDISKVRESLNLRRDAVKEEISAEKTAQQVQDLRARIEKGDLKAQEELADLERREAEALLKQSKQADIEALTQGFDEKTAKLAGLKEQHQQRLLDIDKDIDSRLKSFEELSEANPQVAAQMTGELVNDVEQIAENLYGEAMERLRQGAGAGILNRKEMQSAIDIFNDIAQVAKPTEGKHASKLFTTARDNAEAFVVKGNTATNADVAQALLNVRKFIYQTLGPKAAGGRLEGFDKSLYDLSGRINKAMESLSRKAENQAVFSDAISATRAADNVWAKKSLLDKMTKKYKKRNLVDGTQRTKFQFNSSKAVKEMMSTKDGQNDFRLVLNKLPEILDSITDAGVDVGVLKTRAGKISEVFEEGVTARGQVDELKLTRKAEKSEIGKQIRQLSNQERELGKQYRKQIKEVKDKYSKQLSDPKLKPKTRETIQAKWDKEKAALQSKLDKLEGTGQTPLGEKEAVLKELDKKIQLTSGNRDEVADIIMDVLGKDPRKVMERKQLLREALEHINNNPSMNTLERYAFVLKKLGQSSPEDLKKLDELIELNQTKTWLKDHLKRETALDRMDVFGPVTAIGAGALGGIPAAAASMAVTKAIHLINSPYNALAAIPVVEGVARAGTKLVDKFQKKLITSLTSPAVSRSLVATDVGEKKYKERTEALKLTKDPQVLMDNTSKSLEGLAGTPQVQFALMDKISKANAYLQQKMPVDPLEADYLNPAMSKWKPSSQQMAEFNRIYEVIENPALAMERLSDGTITPEEAEAIQAVHPEIFQKMQGMVIEVLTELKKPVNYDKKVSLSIMFGIPTDPTTNGEYIQYMQQMINSYNQEEQAPKSNLKFDPDTLLSDNQRISMR